MIIRPLSACVRAPKLSFAAVVDPAAPHCIGRSPKSSLARCFVGAFSTKWCATMQATASATSDTLMKATPDRQTAEKRASAAGWGPSNLVRCQLAIDPGAILQVNCHGGQCATKITVLTYHRPWSAQALHPLVEEAWTAADRVQGGGVVATPLVPSSWAGKQVRSTLSIITSHQQPHTEDAAATLRLMPAGARLALGACF